MGEHSSLADRLQHSRYVAPATSVVLGVAVAALFLHGGDWRGAVWSVGLATGFGAAIFFGGRSETIRGLRGDGRDERFALIDMRATSLAGLVLILAVIVGFMSEVARGHDGSPYTGLGALAGLVYVAAIVVQRVRS